MLDLPAVTAARQALVWSMQAGADPKVACEALEAGVSAFSESSLLETPVQGTWGACLLMMGYPLLVGCKVVSLLTGTRWHVQDHRQCRPAGC